MSTNTTNMAMGKAVDGDNSKTYLETTLGAALDKIDAHDHSGTTHGLNSFSAGLTIAASGLTISAGNIGVGGAPNAAYGLWVANNGALLSGVIQYGIHAQPSGSSAATTEVSAVVGNVQGAASATTTKATAFHALTGNKGSSGTVTSMYGLLVDAQTQGSTNNYGIYIDLPSGGSGENYALRITDSGRGVAGGFSVTNDIGGVTATTTFTSSVPSLGGGATATLGTIGGVGPASASQAAWIKIYVGTTARYIPVWA